MIYFDNAATTYPKPQVVYDAVEYAMKNYSFNAGRGLYSASKKTFDMIQQTREKIASLVDTNGSNVIFTSSATESLNNIIYGLNLCNNDCVFVSPFEHNAIIRTLYKVGVKVMIIPFSKDSWSLKEQEFEDLLVINKPKAILISHISNVTGFELPYNEIFEISRRHNCVNILDSAQGFGVYKINSSNVDYIVFAGHKSLFAIFGIAGYIKMTNYEQITYKVGGTGSDSLNPMMPSEMPSKYEAGSMNSIGIYSINKSIDYLLENNFDEKEKLLLEHLISYLRSRSEITIYLPSSYISNGIVSFNISGFTSDEIASILSDEYDICVRSGYHCAPFIHDFIDSKKHKGTVRVSLSGFNTMEEIDCLISAINEIIDCK